MEVSAENRILLKTKVRVISNDLTDDRRHVIILRFLEGFSLKETAAIIGKTVANVNVTQIRAISALGKALDYQVVETRALSVIVQSMVQAYLPFDQKWGVRIHAGASGIGVVKRLVAGWEEGNAASQIVPLFQSKGSMHNVHGPT